MRRVWARAWVVRAERYDLASRSTQGAPHMRVGRAVAFYLAFDGWGYQRGEQITLQITADDNHTNRV